MAEDPQSDERALNALTGHTGTEMRRGYQQKADPMVRKKAAETRVAIRRMAREASGGAAAAVAAPDPKPTPSPTPASVVPGKVEHQARAEVVDSAGATEDVVRAGDRARTGDVQLGKLAFYH